MAGISRREFMGGAAAVAAAAALPVVRTEPARAGVSGALRGITVNKGAYGVSSYLTAAKIADGYVGLPLAVTFEKVYMGHGQFTMPEKVAELKPAGCQFLISTKPSTTRTVSQQKALAGWLAMLKQQGVKFRCVLYSEPNDKAFLTAAEWLPYWRYYAPVIKDAGCTLVYEPGCGGALARGEALFPSKPYPDEMWVDFYCTGYRGGSRLDTILGIAHAAGVPSGIGEWGWQAGNANDPGKPPTMAIWDEYGTYLLGLIGARKITLGATYFDARFGELTSNVITGPDDPRIPMIKKMATAL
jgi:TAT (twin-arginine translocation) pathway-exported protein